MKIKKLNLGEVEKVGGVFLVWNESLLEVHLANLVEAEDYFLEFNQVLQELNCPKLVKVRLTFLYNHPNRYKLTTVTQPRTKEKRNE